MKVKDYIIDTHFEIKTLNLLDLRDELVSTYKERFDFDFAKYSNYVNDRYSYNKNVYNTLDNDVYVYNTINVLDCGDYKVLLDGHRRLYLNFDKVPNFDVPIRVYKREDLTNHQLIKLMVHLNQHKIIGSGSGFFMDNGFTILFKILFDVDFSDKMQFIKGFLYGKSSDVESIYYRDKLELTVEQIPTIIDGLSNMYFIHALKVIDEIGIEELKKVSKFGKAIREFCEENNTYIDVKKLDISNFASKSKIVNLSSSHANDVKNLQDVLDKFKIMLNNSIGKKIYTTSQQREEFTKLKKEFTKKYTKISETRAIGGSKYHNIFNLVKEGKSFYLHILICGSKGNKNVLPAIHFTKEIDEVILYNHLLVQRMNINDYVQSIPLNIDDKNVCLNESNYLHSIDENKRIEVGSVDIIFFIGEKINRQLKVTKRG